MKLTKLFCGILLAGALFSCATAFAQATTSGAAQLQSSANGKIIMAYYAAFEKKDWSIMQQVLAPGFTFSSPIDDHISIAVFKKRCWPNAYKIKKFDVDKVVINGDEAFVATNGWTTTGKLFRNGEYFKLKGGKILAYECFFGPGINYPNNSGK
jgi:ketosteroid isomerase-like protein